MIMKLLHLHSDEGQTHLHLFKVRCTNRNEQLDHGQTQASPPSPQTDRLSGGGLHLAGQTTSSRAAESNEQFPVRQERAATQNRPLEWIARAEIGRSRRGRKSNYIMPKVNNVVGDGGGCVRGPMGRCQISF